MQLVEGRSGDEFHPGLRFNQIQLIQCDRLLPVRYVMQCEDALIAAHALPPKAEYLPTEMEGVLGSVRVKSAVQAANRYAPTDLAKYTPVQQTFVGEGAFEFIDSPLVPVDRAQSASIF